MNAVEYKALQINKIIKETDVYQTYLYLRKSISKKYELQEDDLKNLQQEIVNLAYDDETKFVEKKLEYFKKKKQFYNDPLIKNFIKAYHDLSDMINDVKNIIEAGV